MIFEFELEIVREEPEPPRCKDCGAVLVLMGYYDDLRCPNACSWKRFERERKDKQ